MPNISSDGDLITIFISKANNEKGWRKYEILVSAIESDVGPVVSPARINNIAGDLVEVDVLLENFDFCQVRDRQGKQGRPWLEQIIGQKESFEKGRPIVVSTNGFTKQAVNIARSQKIKLRVIKKVENTQLVKYKKDTICSIVKNVAESKIFYDGPIITGRIPILRKETIRLKVCEKYSYIDALTGIVVAEVAVFRNKKDKLSACLVTKPTGQGSVVARNLLISELI